MPDQTQPACSSWQANFDRLSDADQRLLQTYGILLRRDWVVSPSLVEDCAQRLEIEKYLGAALAGSLNAAQKALSRRNIEALSRVLTKAWGVMGHSPAVRDDGAFNAEKWGILKSTRLPQAVLLELLRQSLASEGLSAGLVEFLLNRPAPGFGADIEGILRREESAARDSTSTTKIYCWALLYSMGHKSVREPPTKLLSGGTATPVEKRVISAVLVRVKAGKRVRWQDLEALEAGT